MILNLFGSTGVIGTKTLLLIKSNFPNIKVNLLTANNNYRKLIQQVKIFKPKYVFIKNSNYINLIKSKINNKIRILNEKELTHYLNNSQSDFSILAISGYQSLYFLKPIILNTKNLGIVNKECIVSAGLLIDKLVKKSNIKISPLDSEHFSLKKYFDNKKPEFKKIFITASGGPFYKKKWKDIKLSNYKEAVNHPKWKMGYKNSIDSATLANKCLELIEAHYLFKIPFSKLDILIHPQALVHSVIEFNNYTAELNYFYHNMDIPLINFLNLYNKESSFLNFTHKKYDFNKNLILEFNTPNSKLFPILSIFNKIDKKNPREFIKFNLANEFAVNLFKNKKILFGEIHIIIRECMGIKLNKSVNTIKNVIDYHTIYNQMLIKKYENL